jgi:hypothetical protein
VIWWEIDPETGLGREVCEDDPEPTDPSRIKIESVLAAKERAYVDRLRREGRWTDREPSSTD